MSLRRPPRHPFQRLSDGNRAQRTGGAGLLYNAAPIPAQAAATAQALASVASVSDKAWNDETFTLASNGAQTVTLEYLPVDESEDVKLNGLGQLRTTDWTRSDQTLSVLSAMGALTGDKLAVHYQYLTGQPTPIGEDFAGLVAGLGPLAWWRLGDVSNGGTMTDSSGNAHHGTWNASATHTVGTSLLLNDSNSSLQMTGASGEGAVVTSGAWMDLTSNLSWLVLFKTTDTAARLFAREQTAGGGQDWSLQITNQLHFCAAGSVIASSVDTSVNDNSIHMAVFTYDGANVKIYLDGALDKTQAYTTPLGTAAYNILIGYGGGTATGHMFTGTLDEAIIFDQVLTLAEITELWAAAT